MNALALKTICRHTRRNYCDLVLKNFDDIPGPKPLPYIGTAWKYLPIVGSYSMDKMHIANEKKMKEFGPIVREEIVPNVFIVSVFRPEDIETVYKSEGKFPARRSHLAVEHYRLSRPNIYNSGGLLPTNGEKWWMLRSAFQKSLGKIQYIRQFLPSTNDIMDEFLLTLNENKELEDFQPFASRLGLELMWTTIFGNRLGAISLSEEDVPTKLMRAAEMTTSCILATDNTEHIWKKWKTPAYRRIEKLLNFIESIVLPSVIDKKRRQTEGNINENDISLLGQYFQIKELDFKDVTGMAVDLVLGGIDTTSYTSSFMCWHLTQNMTVQEKLHSEANRLLPKSDSPVTAATLNEAYYARAVLKETFRLNPIAVGISRNLSEDASLSGYRVPKGTLVITQNMVACRQEEFFPRPDEFIPERWMKGSAEYQTVSPYLILPFSHGPRTCIARRLAEQNLLVLLLKMSKNYKLEWAGRGRVGVVTPLICKPDRPVRLRLSTWT